MFEMLENFDEAVAPTVLSYFNRKLLMDIPQGTYVTGNRGENVLVGGIPMIFSFAGPGNMGKTEELIDSIMCAIAHSPSSKAIIYDSENSMQWSRIQRIANKYPELRDYDFAKHAHDPDTKLLFVQKRNMNGEKFWELLKNLAKGLQKSGKEYVRTLPFRDARGKIMREQAAIYVAIDTLTHFSFTSIDDDIVAKNEIGDKKNQTMFMRDGLLKTQLFVQLNNITASNNFRIGMSSHVGTKIEMDAYAPKAPGLTFGPNGLVHKGVPEKFAQINEHLIEILNSKPLTGSDKLPEYPNGELDKDKNATTDLMIVNMTCSRNKGGPSGVMYPVVYSQMDGIRYGLTYFHYCKMNNRFGIGGNLQNYYLDFLPEVKLRRGNVNENSNDPKFVRAAELTTEILQMRIIWRKTDPLYLQTPESIREKCIAQGYDWDTLLNTRGHFMYHEDEVDQLPYMSALDLLEIADGVRHPYWLEKDNKTVIKEHWKLGDWKD